MNALRQQQTGPVSKGAYALVVLGILQALAAALYIALMTIAANQTTHASEYSGLIIVFIMFPLVGLMAVINLIGLPLYMRKHKLHGKALLMAAASLTVSVLVLYFMVSSFITPQADY
jgi:hypothetical protein